jgi:hypothetical protein
MNIIVLDDNTNIKIYITMEKITKQLIKEAILEALYEFSYGGVAVTSEGDVTGEEGESDGSDNNNNNNSSDKKEEGNKGSNTGNTGKPIEPDPIWPPLGFSLRKK